MNSQYQGGGYTPAFGYPPPPPSPAGPPTGPGHGPMTGGPLGPVPEGYGLLPPPPGALRRGPPLTTGRVVAISLLTSTLVCAVFFACWLLLAPRLPLVALVQPLAPPQGSLGPPPVAAAPASVPGTPVPAPVAPAAAPAVVALPAPAVAEPAVPTPQLVAPAGAQAAPAPAVQLPAAPTSAASDLAAAHSGPVVPALVRTKAGAAEAALRARGYRIELRYRNYDEDVSPLQVVGQSPPAGTPLPVGGTVTLFVNPEGE